MTRDLTPEARTEWAAYMELNRRARTAYFADQDGVNTQRDERNRLTFREATP